MYTHTPLFWISFPCRSLRSTEPSLCAAWHVLTSCLFYTSVQFSSVAQSCPTLCDPMNHSTPGLPVHHQLPEFTQTHVHRVGDAIQPSHPLSSPSPPAPDPSQHQRLYIVVYIYVSPNLPGHPTHTFPPQCPYFCSLHLCLYCCSQCVFKTHFLFINQVIKI